MRTGQNPELICCTKDSHDEIQESSAINNPFVKRSFVVLLMAEIRRAPVEVGSLSHHL